MKRTAHLHASAAENHCTAPFGLHPSCFLPKKKSFFFFLFALSCGLQLEAQLALKAKPLNIFVQPSQPLSPPDTIDVLSKSELSSCGVSGTTVQLVDAAGTALHGVAGFDPISKSITYKPTVGFTGQDSLKYRLICGTQIETAVVLINVDNKPEVIIDDACAVVPAGVSWSIAPKSSNEHNLSPYLGVVVGDIDNDGIVEIIAAANPQVDGTGPNGYNRETKSIAIYKGNNIEAPPFVFDTEKPYTWHNSLGKFGIVKTRIGSQDTTLIVVWECDRYLRAYNYNGEKVWQSNAVYHSIQYGQTSGSSPLGMSFADFNKDGIPEILISTKLFDSATGNLLCSRTWESAYPPYAADLYGNGKLSYVVGHRIYDINIQSLDDVIQNTFDLVEDNSSSLVYISSEDPDYPGSSKAVPNEGKSVAVDVDHDGRLDLVIASNNFSSQYTILWIYDPVQKIVKATKYLPNGGVCGYPFVGDIDGDGNVEIVLIKAPTSSTSGATDNIIAYKYEPGNPVLQEFWRLPHNDPSGVTGITLFDFDQDGKAEIVYRDETLLRIIDGTADGAINYPPDRNKNSFANISNTGYEYPVIADVDGDGQAEIIIIGGKMGVGNPYYKDGFLWVFKSDNPDAPWAPARPVWNQYCYNPVYVNDDLSIPANPLNPATFFVDKDGNYLQPFNNFLQQATLLNDQGKMLSYGPKLEYANTETSPVQYTDLIPNTSVIAHFTVLNTGDADFKGPLYVSAYFLKDGLMDYHSTMELGDENNDGDIEKGTQKAIDFPIYFSGTGIADPTGLIQIRLNDRGDGTPLSPLCSYFGTYSKPPFHAPDYFLHHGKNTIYYYPPNSGYTYVWYDKYPNVEPKPDFVATGDSYSFTPAHTIEKFHVEVYNGTTLVELRPPVNTYLVPDSLIWTGNAATGSQDWNNPANWNYPHDPDPEISGIDTVRYKVPGIYTNVLISGRLTAPTDYPDLTAGKTVYSGTSAYGTALCDTVYFAHGGELLRTDLLSYSKACVNLTVQANRWYMFSPPLRNMYSGDFYRTTPNPFAASEQQTAYTMLYNAQNPEVGGSYQSGNWTGVFNTPNRPLHPGSGIAVWIDKHGTNYGEHPEVTLAFPKNDAAHYLYNPLRPADANISSPPMPTLRSHNGRFIYEGDDEKIAADGNITLQDMAGQKSGSVLVGNPFMAHLDFNEFYKANAAALGGSNQYKLAAGVDEDNEGVISTFYSYLRSGSEYISTAPDGLPGNSSGRIPPMQAFIIDVIGGSVQANISHTVTSVAEADTFRSAASVSQSSRHLLQILATRGAAVSKALVLQGAAYSTNYLPSEDSYKLFVSGMALDPETALDVLKPVQVYTRSSDGYALDINLIGTSEQDITVPLGIRISEKGEIVLNFFGMESFGEETGIYLYDTQYPERLIDLSTQPEYAFGKTEDTLYLENRLSLIIGKNTLARPLGFSNVSGISAARIISRPHGMLRIISENGKTLGDIRITDSWGRLLLDVSAVSSSVYEYQTPTPGIYIVRVGAEVKKVVSIQ